MTEQEILALQARAQQGDVWWHDVATGTCRQVMGVDLKWVEFPEEPDLAEPAAILAGGGVVALCNVTIDQFVTLERCFGGVVLEMGRKSGLWRRQTTVPIRQLDGSNLAE